MIRRGSILRMSANLLLFCYLRTTLGREFRILVPPLVGSRTRDRKRTTPRLKAVPSEDRTLPHYPAVPLVGHRKFGWRCLIWVNCRHAPSLKARRLYTPTRTSETHTAMSAKSQKQPYGLAPFRSAAVLIQVRKDKRLNRPARYCNSRSGLTIRSGDNPTSTVAATRIGRMGGWVR